MSKIKAIVLLSFVALVTSNCNLSNRSMQEVINDPFDSANTPYSEEYVNRRVEMAPLQMPRNIIVCRSKQCAPVNLAMSKEYIYNSLAQLMQNNNNQKALICAADTGTRNCYSNFISLPIVVGITPAYMFVDSVKISDVHLSKGSRSVKLMLNYNVTYNGQTPDCAPDKTLLFVKNTDNIVMEDEGYQCKMTTIGTTTVKTLFLIDYIDMDYGFIGGYLSIGLSGPAYGGGSGYMMIRLAKKALPLKENLPVVTSKKHPTQVEVDAANHMASPANSTTSANTSTNGVQIFPINRKK